MGATKTPRRFRVKRAKPFDPQQPHPWKMKDASRPAFLGQYSTHALAMRAIEEKLASERGYVPTRAEIRAAMAAEA